VSYQAHKMGSKESLRYLAIPPLLLVLALLAGCGGAPTPPPTVTPAPTPTAALTPTPTPLPTLTPVPTPMPGGLYVDAGRSLGAISPTVYGTNYGPWITVPYDLQEMANAAGITYLRFPGGNWGDQNDLTERQIDQFIALAEQMGAEPSISVRLEGGTVERAVELVRYVNVEKGYGVRYWSIGNEPSLYEDYDTERYNVEWRQFAEAMRGVDADLLLIGPDIHQYTDQPSTDPQDPQGRDWMQEFLKANGDLVDIVAIHRYPFPRSMSGAATTIDELRANSREWDVIIPKLRADIREITGRDLPVAVTEINSHWSAATGGEATPDSTYNAIWWGDALGRMIRQGVEIVAHFALQSPSTYGGWGLLARYEARPTYYVYQLYQHFGEELIYASSDEPDVSIYAARREDGALTLMLVNLGPDEASMPLRLDGFQPGGPAEIWRLDAEHPAEQVGTQAISDGDDLLLPGQSLSLYILR
jgi:hypothetical protein